MKEKQKTVYLIAGGDQRQVHLANLLSAENTVYTIGFSEEVSFSERAIQVKEPAELTKPADILILPVPAMSGSQTISTPLGTHALFLDDALSCAAPNAFVMGGMLSPELEQKCRARGFRTADYMQREELAVLNAIPTAEGAVQIAMQELPTTLFGQKCLITGFGRISRVLAHDLIALGMKVTVTARKFSDLAWITIYGAKKLPISQMEDSLKEYDLIINTVPAKLFDRSALSHIRKSTLIIDLASKPGGVDFDAAQELGLNTVWALSLPGKVAPISAGQIICDTIHNILSETEG